MCCFQESVLSIVIPKNFTKFVCNIILLSCSITQINLPWANMFGFRQPTSHMKTIRVTLYSGVVDSQDHSAFIFKHH